MHLRPLLLLAALAACGTAPERQAAPLAAAPSLEVRFPDPPPLETSQDISQFRAGEYSLDRRHTSVTWRIRHYGLSMFTARFDSARGTLTLDPAHPEASRIDVSIDVASVSTGIVRPNGERAFDNEIAAALGVGEHPQITFASDAIRRTGPNRGIINGVLSLNGLSMPVQLDAHFIGGDIKEDRGPTALTGLAFSARTTIRRSDFHIAPNWNDFVGDDVEILIETEFWGEQEAH